MRKSAFWVQLQIPNLFAQLCIGFLELFCFMPEHTKQSREKKKKVFGNFILLALENNDTFGVNKWSLNLITHHYKCITHSPAFLMTTSQFNAKLDKKYYPEKKGRTKGKIPHIFLIDQKILQILHFGTQLLGELQSFLL